ncbi:hypothetical protein L6164_003577 [Bauhinia variegata]|uniref:Uncharacterized protein n=1 Tax=Bauhinia variegata TaxID=167791 RepID=A0ACB9Q1R3_BAUVA|nr:hypothetical protein L6164_003577 [Bauhinia variegata]
MLEFEFICFVMLWLQYFGLKTVTSPTTKVVTNTEKAIIVCVCIHHLPNLEYMDYALWLFLQQWAYERKLE